jgi:hypothetical protein
MHVRMLPEDESCWSFPAINCASVFVNKTLDQSDGDKGYDDGRNEEGLRSSSLALTTVDSFEGKRERRLLSNLVI